MRILLDTHTFLWFVWDHPRLSQTAGQLIRDPSNQILLSLVSTWEIAIKASLGKLALAQTPSIFVPEQLRLNRFELLMIELTHTLAVAALPLHHRDPFDRLLVAQAMIEQTPILSADPLLDRYSIQRLW